MFQQWHPSNRENENLVNDKPVSLTGEFMTSLFLARRLVDMTSLCHIKHKAFCES